MEEFFGEIIANLLGGILQGIIETLFEWLARYIISGLFNVVVWTVKMPGAFMVWAFMGFKKPFFTIFYGGNDFGLIMLTISFLIAIIIAVLELEKAY